MNAPRIEQVPARLACARAASSSAALVRAGDGERGLRAPVVQVALENLNEERRLALIPRGDGRADLGDVYLHGRERSRAGRGPSGDLLENGQLLALDRLRLDGEAVQLRGRDRRAECLLGLREPDH